MDTAPPKRGTRRSKAPDVEPGVDVDVAIDEPGEAAPAPSAAARAGRAVEARSAANLEMMGSLVGGALAGEGAGAPGSARSIIAPVLFSSTPPPPSESSPLSGQPLSDRELLIEPEKAPVSRRKPSFFDIGDDAESRARIFGAAPAPFDPHVPSLPSRADSEAAKERDSGLVDIRRLAAIVPDPKKKKKVTAGRVDDDIFRLTGGLFSEGARAPLKAPDLNALIAPVLPEAPRGGETTRPSFSLGVIAKPSDPPPRRPAAAVAASKRSSRAGWAVGIAALGAGLLLLVLKLSQSGEATPTVAPTESATPPPSALATAAPSLPVAAAPTVVATTATATATSEARDPGAPVKHDKDPVGATTPTATTTAAPRSTATSAPVVTAPVVTAPVVTPPPPPAGGAEFDRSAAIAALNAAAGRAAACKQPDDPAGGASVSVTFAPSGRVTSSKVTTPPFQGTPTGGCIASAFRAAKVPPFEGAPVSVTKNVSLR